MQIDSCRGQVIHKVVILAVFGRAAHQNLANFLAGLPADVIEVARGFAANYLLPREMAILATPGNLKQLEARMHNIHKREAAKRGDAEGLAAQIAGKALVVVGENGTDRSRAWSLPLDGGLPSVLFEEDTDGPREEDGPPSHVLRPCAPTVCATAATSPAVVAMRRKADSLLLISRSR